MTGERPTEADLMRRFARRVKLMRSLQRRYFAGDRSTEVLRLCRDAEAQVDRGVDWILRDPAVQGSLRLAGDDGGPPGRGPRAPPPRVARRTGAAARSGPGPRRGRGDTRPCGLYGWSGAVGDGPGPTIVFGEGTMESQLDALDALISSLVAEAIATLDAHAAQLREVSDVLHPSGGAADLAARVGLATGVASGLLRAARRALDLRAGVDPPPPASGHWSSSCSLWTRDLDQSMAGDVAGQAHEPA